MIPTLQLFNRQRQHRLPLPWLKKILRSALPRCQAHAKSSTAPLLQLEEIELSIVSDADIARVHGEFLADATPTDVITFHHGEILVSADTALRQGLEHGFTVEHELALYMIHGLMHLGDWEDHDEAEAAEMTALQEGILKECLTLIQA